MAIKKVEGVVPVMLTPFNEDGSVDYKSLGRLVEWYVRMGADALFAVCQSSEMIYLSLEERSAIAKFVVEKVGGRIPVVTSGHISDDPYSQLAELKVAAESGADGVVLVTNHLDPKQKGTDVFLGNLKWLMDRLPVNMPLGLYECPVPYRRLMTDEEIRFCAASGRFIFIKDVSCDLSVIKRRVAITREENSNFAILNANAAIAYDAIKEGAKGFNGVNANLCPDLYKWLITKAKKYPTLETELADFLSMLGCMEAYGYPVIAKLYHQRIGNFTTCKSRVLPGDIHEKIWGIDAIVDHLVTGIDTMRAKIALMD